MSTNAILPKNLNVKKLKFSAPKTLTNGSRSVYVSYEGERLSLQTPMLNLPYGVGDWNEKNGDDGKDKMMKYDLHVSFRGADENPAIQKMLDKMKEIENHIKDVCFENRVEWLQDDFDGIKNVVDRLFTPIIKVDKDKKTGKVLNRYPPTMKFKLPYDTPSGKFTFEAADMDGGELDFKAILNSLKGAKGRFIIQLAGLWFAGGKYGVTWKVQKCRLQLSAQKLVNYVDDSDDEGGDTKSIHSDEDVEREALEMSGYVSPTPKKHATQLEESGDEEEEAEEPEAEDADAEEEEEDVPPPPPAPVKKGKAPPKAPSPEPEDVDSEIEDMPPPPPKRTTKTAKK
jgi:hypothetical protein